MVAGETDMGFACFSAALPHINSGRLLLLGMTAPKRSPVFPDAPAMAETFPGFEMDCNTGFLAPGGIAAGIADRLHDLAMKVAEQPRLKELLASNSAEPAPITRAQFKAYAAQEIRDWGEGVRVAGLRVQ
jgi:tripartite-type tricarboxylate transporter receptor subunit TctC